MSQYRKDQRGQQDPDEKVEPPHTGFTSLWDLIGRPSAPADVPKDVPESD